MILVDVIYSLLSGQYTGTYLLVQSVTAFLCSDLNKFDSTISLIVTLPLILISISFITSEVLYVLAIRTR